MIKLDNDQRNKATTIMRTVDTVNYYYAANKLIIL